VIDSGTVRIVAVNVESPIAFEQRVMRTGRVAAVDASLYPFFLPVYLAVVKIVICNDRSRACGSDDYDLVNLVGDAILYQNLAG
jgi:hypothetical protein